MDTLYRLETSQQISMKETFNVGHSIIVRMFKLLL